MQFLNSIMWQKNMINNQSLQKIGSLLRKSGLAIQFLLKLCFRNLSNVKIVGDLRVQILGHTGKSRQQQNKPKRNTVQHAGPSYTQQVFADADY